MLTYLYSTLLENKPEGFTIYADIEGAKVNGGSIPPEIMVTSSRPDIVIINRNTSPSSVLLVELTVPFSKRLLMPEREPDMSLSKVILQKQGLAAAIYH